MLWKILAIKVVKRGDLLHSFNPPLPSPRAFPHQPPPPTLFSHPLPSPPLVTLCIKKNKSVLEYVFDALSKFKTYFIDPIECFQMF